MYFAVCFNCLRMFSHLSCCYELFSCCLLLVGVNVLPSVCYKLCVVCCLSLFTCSIDLLCVCVRFVCVFCIVCIVVFVCVSVFLFRCA